MGNPGPLTNAIAAQDIREALALLTLADQVGALLAVLAERGRASGDVPLFMALVQATLRDRLAAPPSADAVPRQHDGGAA